jgi:hypothetical protein
MFYGTLKEIVFLTTPQSIQEPRNRINQETESANRSPGLMQRAVNNFLQGLQQTVRRRGEHFTGVILKKKVIVSENIALFICYFCNCCHFYNLGAGNPSPLNPTAGPCNLIHTDCRRAYFTINCNFERIEQ